MIGVPPGRINRREPAPRPARYRYGAPEQAPKEERMKRHVRLEEIEKAGLGVLVEVEEEDGEQVLIWLR